jgi:hypothetical protein
LTAALADGIARRDWRPHKPAVGPTPYATATGTHQPTTTDDLLKDLDL